MDQDIVNNRPPAVPGAEATLDIDLTKFQRRRLATHHDQLQLAEVGVSRKLNNQGSPKPQ